MLKIKYSKLLSLIKEASYIVVLTGAGISTAAGSKYHIALHFLHSKSNTLHSMLRLKFLISEVLMAFGPKKNV